MIKISLNTLSSQKNVPLGLLLTLICANNLWTLSWINLKFYQILHLVIMFFFIYTTFKYKKRKLYNAYSQKYIIAFIFLPLLSVISCKILHDQSIAASLIVWRMHLGWLLYFILWYKKINEQQIAKAIFYIGIIYAFISLIQQITYPLSPFGSRTLGTTYSTELMNGIVEKRFGFYRFMVGGVNYATATFFILIANKLAPPHKYKKYLLIIILGIVAIGSRQTIAGVFVAYCYYLLYSRNVKNKLGYIIFISCIIFTLYTYSDYLLGSLANVSEDMETSRSFSYIYYFNDYISSPLSIFCGNGVGHESSTYGNEKIYFDGNQVILADIGMLGTLYYWGIIYLLCYIIAIIRFLKNKYLDTHLKAIMLASLLIMWIGTPLWEFGGMLFQALLFYYCDINIYNNKLLQKKI